jgi:TolB-like protein/Tfp pilus assembly protein PilF
MGMAPSHRRVRFGSFEIDEIAGELCKDGAKIRLQEQPFQILQILLEQPGEVVTREEIRKRVWPSDTFVDFDHGINNAIKRLREALGDTAETPRFIETLPRRGYRFIAELESKEKRIPSLVVLPLENLSHDPEQQYFADGLTEALITSLAKISALRVVSRTTAMHYKNTRQPLPLIARELGVEIVVEGTVLRSGDRVRISVQLIEAQTDTHLWAESYDHELQDILTLQADVAQAVAREVQVKLTPQEKQQLSGTSPLNPQAYEAYLKARYHWNKLSPDSMRKAVEYFQEAIAHDSQYTVAYTGLADCSARLGWWGFAAPERGFGAARTAAEQAVQMEPTLAEARGSLGWAIMHYDWNCPAAEAEFRRALELNPNYTSVPHFFAICLGAMSRFDEAIAEINRVARLDPFSLVVNMTATAIFCYARRFQQAIEHGLKGLELDPNFPPGRWALGLAYEQVGEFERAIAELQRAVQLSDGQAVYVAALGHIYASAGRKDDALKSVERLNEISKERYVMPYWLAEIYACLGQRDKAFHWLNEAYKDRSAWLVYSNISPWLDKLRGDRRFHDLLRRMSFP